jgi:hypothetical protein
MDVVCRIERTASHMLDMRWNMMQERSYEEEACALAHDARYAATGIGDVGHAIVPAHGSKDPRDVCWDLVERERLSVPKMTEKTVHRYPEAYLPRETPSSSSLT